MQLIFLRYKQHSSHRQISSTKSDIPHSLLFQLFKILWHLLPIVHSSVGWIHSNNLIWNIDVVYWNVAWQSTKWRDKT